MASEEFLRKLEEPPLHELGSAFINAWEADTSWTGWSATYKVCAARAMQLDHRLNSLFHQCVPMHVSEPEFWRVFFIHMHLALHPAASANDAEDDDEEEDDEDDEDEEESEETQLAQLAEELADEIEDVTMRYELQVLEPARIDMRRLQEMQSEDLSSLTGSQRGSAKASEASVGVARSYRKALEDATRVYEEALEKMHEEHEALRAEHRAAREKLVAAKK